MNRVGLLLLFASLGPLLLGFVILATLELRRRSFRFTLGGLMTVVLAAALFSAIVAAWFKLIPR